MAFLFYYCSIVSNTILLPLSYMSSFKLLYFSNLLKLMQEKFEKKKLEISTQNTSSMDFENEESSQQSIMPSDVDIWIDSFGKK